MFESEAIHSLNNVFPQIITSNVEPQKTADPFGRSQRPLLYACEVNLCHFD